MTPKFYGVVVATLLMLVIFVGTASACESSRPCPEPAPRPMTVVEVKAAPAAAETVTPPVVAGTPEAVGAPLAPLVRATPAHFCKVVSSEGGARATYSVYTKGGIWLRFAKPSEFGKKGLWAC